MRFFYIRLFSYVKRIFANALFGICEEYSVKDCVQYSVHCSVQCNIQYSVQYGVNYSVSYNLQEAGKGCSSGNKSAQPATLLQLLQFIVQYSVHCTVHQKFVGHILVAYFSLLARMQNTMLVKKFFHMI